MSLVILKKLAMDQEATFATQASTDYADYVSPPAENIEWSPAQDSIVQGTQTTTLGNNCANMVGAKSGTLTFDVPLLGASETGISGDPVVDPTWRTYLMQACSYTQTLNEGTAENAGTSTTTTIDVADGTKTPVGTVVTINGEPRIVTASSASQITITPALTSAPSNTDVVYGGAQYEIGTTSTSLTIIAQGDGHYYRFLGCKGVVSLPAATALERPVLRFELQVADWDLDTGAPSTGTFPTFTCPTSMDNRGAQFIWGTAATTTATPRFGFSPNFEVIRELSTEAAEGTADFEISRGIDARTTAEVSVYQADWTTFWTGRDNATENPMIYRFGSASLGWAVFAARKTQVVDIQSGEEDGLVAGPTTLQVNSSGDASIAPFAISFFGATA